MPNYSIYANKVKELRKLSKLTQKDLAKKIGVSNTSISLWERGKTHVLSSRNLGELARALGVEQTDLLGPNQPEVALEAGVFSNEIPQPPPKRIKKSVTIKSLLADSAGRVKIFEIAEVDGGWPVPMEWLIKRGIDPISLRAVTFTGSSMSPGILDGDVLLINVDDTEIPASVPGVFVIQVEGEVSIKRVVRVIGTREVLVSSDRSGRGTAADWVITATQVEEGYLRIIGRVIAHVREL